MKRRQVLDGAARAALIQDCRAANMTWSEIAKRLGMTPDGVQSWWRCWIDQQAAKSKKAPRSCLGRACGVVFMSDGPHHRMCPRCRPRAESVSCYEPNPGGSTGKRVMPMRSGSGR